ncbi:hypothetical protein ACWIGL_15575 [Streptomyces albidoflavus]
MPRPASGGARRVGPPQLRQNCQLDLSALTQEVLDLWLTTHPTRRQGIGAFVRWTLARHLTSGIKLPSEVKADASHFLTEDEHYGQLRRCLNDDQLPLDVRITGAMVRLYGMQVTRIVTLTTDRFHKEETDWYVTFDREPVLLPPKLGRLIEEQIRHPARVSMLEQLPGDGPRYLWPGRPASRPIGGGWAHTRLKRHGLPSLSARNTAMTEFVAELPRSSSAISWASTSARRTSGPGSRRTAGRTT